jgi:hypothetical protein
MNGIVAMWRTNAWLRQFFAAVLGGAALLIAFDGLVQTQARSRLQRLADSAAMAGVQSLQDSVGQNESRRRAVAVAASRAVAEPSSNSSATVMASVAPIHVWVRLSQSSGWLRRINGRLDVVGQAGYLPPSQSSNDQQVRLYNRLEWKIETARAE